MSGTWTAVEIAGKPADIFDPPIGRPRFAVVYLHGIGQETLADRQTFTDLFAELGLGCVVPRGGYSWWSDRPLPEFDPTKTAEGYVRCDVVPYVCQRWALPP